MRTAQSNIRMRHQEYPPPLMLAPWIKSFWVFESRSTTPVPDKIVADGSPEIIVHFGSPFAELDQTGVFTRQPVAVVCGQLTQALVLESSENVGMIGIRFHPSGMAPFLGASLQSLTNRRLPVHELFPESDQLIDQIRDSENDSQRIAACCRFLMRSIDPDRESGYVRGALESIARHQGRIPVERLASLVGRSRRSLETAFQREVGTSPKTYCRIVRFRSVFDALVSQGAGVDWVQVALDSGYFDQPHLIRDFGQFAGTSPTTFLKQQAAFAQAVNQGLN